MNLDEQLLSRVELLRIPLDDIFAPLDWKDWYHYILIDTQTGLRVLVNLTFIGRPEQGEIQTSFIITIPSFLLSEQPTSETATFATAYSQKWQPNAVTRLPFCLDAKGIYLEINGENTVIQVQDKKAQLSIKFVAQAQAMPLLVTEDSAFGSGFIGWGLVPGLAVDGELVVCKNTFNFNKNWFCYHDRNFGRFRWGEDIGWEWFVAFATCHDGRKLTFILDRRTNKNHTQAGLPYIFIYLEQTLQKVFLGESLQINWNWTPSPILPLRLPGIMASLFADRTLKMPQSLQIKAADDQDNLLLNINFDSTLELVVPDNQERQYSFIEELSGPAEVRLNLKGEIFSAQGFGYVEYVH